MKADDPRHGETRGYYAHRRAGQTACGPCKDAAAKTENLRQMRLAAGITGRPDATGMQRRLRALAALGYSWAALARELDRTESAIQKLASDRRAYANPPTIQRIDALYQRLHMTLPIATSPHTAGAITCARNLARRNGWPPPLAFDNIDDLSETPTDWEYKRKYGNREEDLRELVEGGANIHQACRELHRSREALEKWCNRHNLSDLYLTLTSRAVTNENQYSTEAVA